MNPDGTVTDNLLTNDSKQYNLANMDITDARGAIPRDDYGRMKEHAELYYDEIRKRKSDVTAIAHNIGFSVEDVGKIKRHIFIDEHDLGKKRPSSFAPDYDMAVSWQRLSEGKDIQEMDIVLLNHELIELGLMAQGISYVEAHNLAEKEYNYAKYIKELNAKEGIL